VVSTCRHQFNLSETRRSRWTSEPVKRYGCNAVKQYLENPRKSAASVMSVLYYLDTIRCPLCLLYVYCNMEYSRSPLNISSVPSSTATTRLNPKIRQFPVTVLGFSCRSPSTESHNFLQIISLTHSPYTKSSIGLGLPIAYISI
jgi:hypothetical protein